MQIRFILGIYLLRESFSGGSHIKVSDMPRESISGIHYICSLIHGLRYLGVSQEHSAGFQAIFASFCAIAQFHVVFPMRIKIFTFISQFIHRCGPR